MTFLDRHSVVTLLCIPVFPASQALLTWAVWALLPGGPELCPHGYKSPMQQLSALQAICCSRRLMPVHESCPSRSLAQWCGLMQDELMSCWIKNALSFSCLVLCLTVVSGLTSSYNQMAFFLSLNQWMGYWRTQNTNLIELGFIQIAV